MVISRQLFASHSDSEITKRRGLPKVVSYEEVNMDDTKTVAAYWLLCTWLDPKWLSIRILVYYKGRRTYYFIPYVGYLDRK